MIRPLATALLVLTASACGVTTQGTSGADYLQRYQTATAAAGQPDTQIDDDIRKAAAVEPILTFPARIGLARIVNGEPGRIPEAEIKVWEALASGREAFGELVAADPLIAELTATAVGRNDARHYRSAGHTIEKIRLGAARQHLDAVLIYEAGARVETVSTALSIADLTILGGYILPTRSMEASGVGRALLLDVRNGYPYGTVTTNADLSELTTTFGRDGEARDLRNRAVLEVVRRLSPEVEALFEQVVAEAMARRNS